MVKSSKSNFPLITCKLACKVLFSNNFVLNLSFIYEKHNKFGRGQMMKADEARIETSMIYSVF